MLACRVFGHRVRFRAQGRVMRWECDRGCGEGGSKVYPSAEKAERYARSFERGPGSSLGSRPTVSTLPIWLWRRMRRRDEQDSVDG